MNKNVLFFNQHIHKIPCVFKALEMLAKDKLIDEEQLKVVSMRFMWFHCENPEKTNWTNNTYNVKHFVFVCRELGIRCKVHYYNANSLNNEIRTRDVGINEKEAKYHIDLALYKEHYLIWEKTKYTRYII